MTMSTPLAPASHAVEAYNAGDFERAFSLFEATAATGDRDAEAWLGALYANGEGTAPSLERSFAHYLRAAEAGHAQAQTNAGAMLIMGQGTAADAAAGAAWLTRAAEQGDAYAQFNLATLYGKGQGVPRDEAEAGRWYRRAAEAGHYPSQARLGYHHAHGIGVEKNRVEAFVWLSLAAQHGVGTALTALEAVVAQMSADEKQQGMALVARWRGRTAEVSGAGAAQPGPGLAMTVFSAQQIKFEFLSYIKEFDLDPQAWRIGVADDARAALFAAHGVDETRDIWLWKPTLSAAAAGLVYTFFTERFGIPAAEPGKATAGRSVFLFRRRAADSNLQDLARGTVEEHP